MRRIIFYTLLASVITYASFASPKIDTSNDRVKTNVYVPYKKLGVLKPKDVSQTKNNITLGCETLDRDYANYDAYKEYIVPLGIKKIRLQGGWAKTEKQKGVYDFAWLDHIINDALSRGVIPWLQTSYGNPIYEGGGTPFLAGGMPTSSEAIAAWENWVAEMAKRYSGKVEWEMWNEPDIHKRNQKHRIATVENNIRTAEIIRKYDPNAKIAALSLASLDTKKFEEHLKLLQKAGKLEIFTWITYHGYRYRPEDTYEFADEMREILKKYTTKVLLRQGENGAPSKGFLGGALTKHNWTELTQAKWDLRRMLGDWGRGIETSVFSISDMRYAKTDAIKVINVKGLLQTDENHNVVHIKMAYYAVQNLVATYDILDSQTGSFVVDGNYKGLIDAFGYVDNETKIPSYTLWFSDSIPTNMNATTPIDATFVGGAKIENPVWVDILTGGVYEIPPENISRVDKMLKIKNLPAYDSPVIITDKSLVDFVLTH